MKKYTLILAFILGAILANIDVFGQSSLHRMKTVTGFGWGQRVVPNAAYLDSTFNGFWLRTGNTVGNNISFIGTKDNRSLLIKTNNLEHLKIDSLGNFEFKIDTLDFTKVPIVVNGGNTVNGNNPYMQLKGYYIGAYRIKNTTTRREWFLQNQTIAGTDLDNFAIGRSSNPSLCLFKIDTIGRVRIGSKAAAATSTLDVTGTMSVSSTSSLNTVFTNSLSSYAGADLVHNAPSGYAQTFRINNSNVAQLYSTGAFFLIPTRIGSGSTPTATLDVTGTMSISSTSTLNGIQNTNYTGSGTITNPNYQASYIYNYLGGSNNMTISTRPTASQDIVFLTNGTTPTETMRLNSSGNMSVTGTSTLTGACSIPGGATIGTYFRSTSTGTTNYIAGSIKVGDSSFPTSTLEVAGTMSVSSTATLQNVHASHVIGKTALASSTLGTGAGTGASVKLTGCTDMAGQIILTTGSGLSTSAPILSVTFGSAYSSAPNVVLTPADSDAASLTSSQQVYVTTTTTGFTINANTVAITDSTQYNWFYTIIQ